MELHRHYVLYLMDKVIFALHPKLLCLNHQQSFAAHDLKVLTGNAISLFHIAIPAFKEASANVLKQIFSHTILMIARILFLLLYFDRIEDNLANATAYIYHKNRK